MLRSELSNSLTPRSSRQLLLPSNLSLLQLPAALKPLHRAPTTLPPAIYAHLALRIPVYWLLP